MLERTSFDTPTLPRLSTIISEFQRGVWRIPEFQRPAVWNDDQRLRLLDSIVKGLPIGSLLVWRSATHDLVTYRELAGVPLPAAKAGDKYTYLLDGHQRMTTLFGALVQPRAPRSGRLARSWPLYYVLGSGESPAFRLPSRSTPPMEWLPLDLLFDNKALYHFRDILFKNGRDDLADEAERVANTFKDYIIPVVPLVTDDLDIATDAFVRINSQGKRMTEAHMLRALTYLKNDIDTDRGFKEIKRSFASSGWGGIPDKTLVAALKAAFGLGVYTASVTELTTALKATPTAIKRLQQALHEATKLLRSFGVAGWGSLPYAYQLVTLTVLAFRRPDSLIDREALLQNWFWRTSYGEYYTGQTGEQIGRDIEILDSAMAGEDPQIARGAEVPPLLKAHGRLVRTRAFLLFLANQPKNEDARKRRQEHLAQVSADPDASRSRSFSYIFPGYTGLGNLILADTSELRDLRKQLCNCLSTPEQNDEFVLPTIALSRLPDVDSFVESRGRFLVEAERRFVETLGLVFRDALPDETDEDIDDEEIGEDS